MNEYWDQTLRLLAFSDVNVRFVFAGMTLLGLASGVLGGFTLLRRRALIGDALAHSALPGIAVAFLLTGVKSSWLLLSGAYVTGVLGVLALLVIRKFTRIKEDAALATVLTVFFGVGIVLLTYIQKTGMGGQSGLDKFLFGKSASLVGEDVLTIAIVTGLLLLLTVLLVKEFKLLCFNAEYASSLGFNETLLDVVLMGMTVAAVVIGLQAVGVVLMSALLIIPPTTARLWTNRFGNMLLLSGLIGAISGALGSYLSFLAPRMPSGPLTVLAATTVFGISLAIAPERGVISRKLRQWRMVRRTALENALRAAVEATEVAGQGPHELFKSDDLERGRGWSKSESERHMRILVKKHRAIEAADGRFKLNEIGQQEGIALVRRHRLWELFLMHQADIAADHVDRDADDSEHFLTPALEARLLELAGEDALSMPSPHPLEVKNA